MSITDDFSSKSVTYIDQKIIFSIIFLHPLCAIYCGCEDFLPFDNNGVENFVFDQKLLQKFTIFLNFHFFKFFEKSAINCVVGT